MFLRYEMIKIQIAIMENFPKYRKDPSARRDVKVPSPRLSSLAIVNDIRGPLRRHSYRKGHGNNTN